jgi:hypothetical protein
MRECLSVSQIVNGNEVDVRIAKCGAKDVSANAAKTVDANLNCHLFSNPPEVPIDLTMCYVFGISRVALVGLGTDV